MELTRGNPTAQCLALLLICLFPAGAYFVYDAPAALMRYFKTGLELNSQEYMSFYKWYSAPNTIMAIVGGILIDKVFGHRLGSVIFCGVVFIGQLMFSYGVAHNYQTFSKIGRSVTGSGVESIAVAANVYLDRWFKGTSLSTVAFGTALAVWRMSSSVSLSTVTPIYKKINTVKPQDGSSEIMSCKACSGWDDEGKENGYFKEKDLFYKDVALAQADKNNQYDHDTQYYCYNRIVLDMCEIRSENGELNEVAIEAWNVGEYSKACNVKNDIISDFTLKSGVSNAEHTNQCFNLNTETNNWEWNKDQCDCLDTEFFPENGWDWINAQIDSYKDDETFKNAAKKIFDLEDAEESQISSKIDNLMPPFYWLNSFGESLGSDIVAIAQRKELVQQLNKLRCETDDFKVAYNFKRFGEKDLGALVLEAKEKAAKLEAEAKSGEKEVIIPAVFVPKAEDNVWKNVNEFVKDMDNTGLYASSCNATESYLVNIADEEKVERRSSLSLVYYLMLVVTILGFIAGIGLMLLDAKVEKNDAAKQKDTENADETKKDETKPEEPQGCYAMFIDQISVIQLLPMETWILYLMCVLFYVCVFLFISQGQNFFLEYTGIAENSAGFVLGLVYIAAVPFNFLVGAILKKVENQVLFLTGAYIICALAHFILMTFKGFFPAACGMILMAFAYSSLGCTMWPLAGLLVSKDITGRMYGFMFATQQLGLTIGADVVGILADKLGWVALEVFFVLCSGVGAFCGFVLVGRVGRSFPESYDIKMEKKRQAERDGNVVEQEELLKGKN